MTTIPRCVRLCNPGNIRIGGSHYEGEIQPSKDKEFKQFLTMSYGFRAVMKNIHTKYAKGRRTVRSLISEWAPPVENNTNSYIERVCRVLRVERDEVLIMNPTVYKEIAKAIFDVEKGSSYPYDATKAIAEGFEMCHFTDVHYS